MASNALPGKRDRLFSLGDDISDGLAVHEVTIGIKQNLESVVRPALAAARAAEAAYGESQVLKKAANATLKTADGAARIFIINSRKRLSKFLGESYSTEWGAAGWPDNSTAVPTSQDDRFSLLASLKTYFTAHPAHESVDMDATAAIADTTHTNVSNARTGLAQTVTGSGMAKNVRDSGEIHLRKRLNGVITELDTLLTAEDPRWHAFGLSRPADVETPEAPSFTTVAAGLPGTVLVDWDDALRADRFRVWLFIVGVDTVFHAVETVEDSDATLSLLTGGSTVKVRVTSLNDAGESVPGPEVQIVVP